MGKQFNIRSEKAREIALDLSGRSGRPLAQVVEDALVEHRDRLAEHEAEVWGPILRETQDAFLASKVKFEIADLYDPETGLPN